MKSMAKIISMVMVCILLLGGVTFGSTNSVQAGTAPSPQIQPRVVNLIVNLVGVVEALSSSALVVKGNNIGIDANTLVRGTPEVGVTVYVRAKYVGANLIATLIQVIPTFIAPLPPPPVPGKVISLVGVVAEFSSSALVVKGNNIGIDANTLVRGTPEVGNTVYVRAKYVGSDLIATIIQVLGALRGPPPTSRIVNLIGVVEALDASSLVLSGNSITIDPNTPVWGTLAVGVKAYVRAKSVGATLLALLIQVITTPGAPPPPPPLPPPPPTTSPTVVTNLATNIGETTARLNGNLMSKGTATDVTVSFVYGTTPGGPYPNETTPAVKNTTGVFSFDVSGLTSGTPYYYKAKAIGSSTVYGLERNFTTTALPTVLTNLATSIGETTARLNGNLTSKGTSTNVTVSFVYGTTLGGPYPNETTPAVKNTTGVFSFDVSGLTSSTPYYYKAKGVGSSTVYGLEQSFTTATPVVAPTVVTNLATNIGETTARLNGDLTNKGTATDVTVSFVYGTTLGGPYPNETTPAVKNATGVFSFDVSGLTSSTPYYYKAKGVGSSTVYGLEQSFTTATPVIAPTVVTNLATNIGETTARLNGNLTSKGTSTDVTVSFVYGTTLGGPYPNETTPAIQNATGVFSFDLSGLTSGTPYYYKAKGVGSSTVYGAEQTFTTTTPPAIDAAALYAAKCALCHGANRQGFLGPALTPTSLAGKTEAQWVTWINNNNMTYGLTAEQLNALVHWLKTVAP